MTVLELIDKLDDSGRGESRNSQSLTITDLYGILDGLIKEGYGPCEILDPDGCDIANVEIRTFPAIDGLEEETVVFLR